MCARVTVCVRVCVCVKEKKITKSRRRSNIRVSRHRSSIFPHVRVESFVFTLPATLSSRRGDRTERDSTTATWLDTYPYVLDSIASAVETYRSATSSVYWIIARDLIVSDRNLLGCFWTSGSTHSCSVRNRETISSYRINEGDERPTAYPLP